MAASLVVRRLLIARRGVAVLVLCVVLVLLAATAWTAWASAGSGTSGYRTAVATRADVRQLLRGTGTVARTGQRSLQFGESGTVGSVPVSVGDHVRAGQVVATLSRAALQAAVTQAVAQQARAKATLAADLAAQSASSSASAGSAASAATPAPAATPTPSASPAPSRGQGSGNDGAVAAAQLAVVRDQRAADAALQVATAALDAQHGACTVPDASDAAAVAACRSALDTVTAAQQKVAAAQHQAQDSIDALARLLSTGTLPSSAPSTSAPSKTSPSTTAPTSTRSSVTAAASSHGTGDPSGSGTVTAATLARDQSAIDTARAALIRARHSLASARLTSPVAGIVAAVGIAVGDQTAASDTMQVVVLSDDGQAEVTMDVAEDDVRSVAVGQAAEVLADGSPTDLPGRVTSIGLLSSSTSGTAAYPVTVSVGGAPPSMADGSQAAVSLVTKTVHDAVTVPTSAVLGSAASATVRVLSGGTVTTARVVVGAVGAERVQIVSGVKPGQRVVLADLSEPLPTGDTGTGRFGGGGGFGGGGPPGLTGTGQRVVRGG
jgi:multidrug efflux pump subunit AcrA (membrane-fusion protein)